MKKFLSDTLFITIGGLLNRLKGIVFIPFITAAAGTANYGAFVLILDNIRMTKPFASIGLGMGFQRFASAIDKDEKHLLSQHFFSIFLPTVLFGTLGAGLLYLLAPVLNEEFFSGKYLAAIQLSSLAVLSNTCFSNVSKFLLARKKFKLYSVLTLLYELSPYTAFVIGLMIRGEVFWGILCYVITDLFMISIMVISVVKDLKLVWPSRLIFVQYFLFSYPLAISEIEGGLLNKVDKYCIGAFMDLNSVAIYNVIIRACGVIDFVTTPIRKQMMSYLPKVWDKGFKKESIQTIRQTLLLFLLITVGLLACFTLYMQQILEIFLQEEREIAQLELIVLLIGFGIIFSASKRFYYLLIKLKNQSMDQLIYQLVGVIPNFLLNYLLIPEIGLLGAALATFVSFALILIAINAKHKLDIDLDFFKHFGSFLVISLSMFLIKELFNFDIDTVWLLILSVGISFVSYFGLIFLLKRSFLLTVKKSFEDFRQITNSSVPNK